MAGFLSLALWMPFELSDFAKHPALLSLLTCSPVCEAFASKSQKKMYKMVLKGYSVLLAKTDCKPPEYLWFYFKAQGQ